MCLCDGLRVNFLGAKPISSLGFDARQELHII